MQKKVDDAMVWHRRTLAIRERALPPSHPDIACSAMNIGYALREGGRPNEAIPWLLRALAIFETAYPPTHPATGETLVSLAKAYLDTHRAAEALPLLDRARTALGEKAEAGSLADWEFTTAQALRAAGRDPGRSLKLAREARALFAGEPALTYMVAPVDRFLGKRVR
jgi:tetratricopeptide (TPR) repeat protein